MSKLEKIQHSMNSFGAKEVSHAQIRFERLENRVIPNIPFPHKHSFYQFLLITHGKGSHTIDFQEHMVVPKKLFLMKPGQMHSWKLQENTKGILLEFNRESLSFFKESNILNLLDHTLDSSQLDSPEYERLKTLLEEGVMEFAHQNQFQEQTLGAYLMIILGKILQIKNLVFKNSKMSSVTQQFSVLLEENYRTHHDVDFYASQLHMSPKNLSMQITRSLGRAPRQLIQERLHLESKRLLAYTDLSIGLIADHLGFIDQNYFARFFKKLESKSPKDSRMALKKLLSL